MTSALQGPYRYLFVSAFVTFGVALLSDIILLKLFYNLRLPCETSTRYTTFFQLLPK